MKFTIHSLDLQKHITISPDSIADDGTIELIEFASLVRKNDLEPTKMSFAQAISSPLYEITPGTYLFTQGVYVTTTGTNDELALIQEASEQLWLESLWREILFKNDRILVRILQEDGNMIFQVFREIDS